MTELDKIMEESKSYAITWHVCAIDGAKKSKVSVAVCSYNPESAAFVSIYNPRNPSPTETLKVMVIQDVRVGKGCEDGARCFNLRCPKNHAAFNTIEGFQIRSKEELEKIHANLQKITADLNPKIAEHGVSLYYEKPIGSIRRKKK